MIQGLGQRQRRDLTPPKSGTQPPLFLASVMHGSPRDLVTLISWLVSPTTVQSHHIFYTSLSIRVSNTATTPSHAATALHRAKSTSQRVSSKVLASAGSRARLRNQRSPPGVVHRAQDLEMPTSRSHDLRAVERRTGVLGRGCLVSSHGGNRSFLSATRLLCLAASFCWACGDVVPFSPVFVSLSVPVACGHVPKESRLLCQKPGREGILLYRGGHDLVMLFAVALILTCCRFERSDGHGR